MTVLIVGASGATGKHLVDQLIQQRHYVKAIVRSPEKIPDHWKNNDSIQLIFASILNLSDEEIRTHVSDCEAVLSCLGHSLTFKGIYGKPRRLVTDATKKLCQTIQATTTNKPIKFILMNTAGNRNRNLAEPISFAQKCVLGLIRLLLPPHIDNEKAAEYLRTQIGQSNPSVEWIVVRPDTLTVEANISEYVLYPSPTRSAIFNAGKTSRVNVGYFMANLAINEVLWETWKGQMPVIYNQSCLD